MTKMEPNCYSDLHISASLNTGNMDVDCHKNYIYSVASNK